MLVVVQIMLTEVDYAQIYARLIGAALMKFRPAPIITFSYCSIQNFSSNAPIMPRDLPHYSPMLLLKFGCDSTIVE